MRPVSAYRLRLLGNFKLESVDGEAILVSSRKARALLAILAMSPDGERSRTVLQDLLWSRCERAEAQSSLRRELSTLRKTLNSAADVLSIGRDFVRLNLHRCAVDALEGLDRSGAGEFLEGLDLHGEEAFEDWLRVHRSHRGKKTAYALPSPVPTNRPAPIWPVVAVRLESWSDDDRSGRPYPELLCEQIIRGLREAGTLTVVAHQPVAAPSSDAPDINLLVTAMTSAGEIRFVIRGHAAIRGDLLISMTTRLDIGAGSRAVAEAMNFASAECVDRVLHAAALRLQPHAPHHVLGKKVFTAIGQMFSLNRDQVRVSRGTLLEACGLSKSSVLHAWLAYQAIFEHDHAHSYDLRATLAECRENMRIAIDLDPYNSLSLSLCAHVYAFMFRDFQIAYDLMQRAAAVGGEHVMYFDTLAMLYLYTGRMGEARDAALRAASLGRHLAFRYCFATSLCMIDALAGRFESSIMHAHRSMAFEPDCKTVGYPPTRRYLGAALSALRKHDEAALVFDELRAADPNFRSSQIDKYFGPAPSEPIATLFRNGLMAVGL